METTSRDHPADQARLQTLFGGLAEAWTRNDAASYGALFSQDADYVAFDGSHQHGRQAIAQSHRALFGGPLQGSRLEGRVTDLRFLTPEVAILHAVGNTAFSWQRSFDPRRRSIQTYVAQKTGGEWLFVAFHNTRIRPMTRLEITLFAFLLKLRRRR